jgi:hypothetical protein
MNPQNLPVVGSVLRLGANDRALDSILLAGPAVIATFALFGRNLLTTALTSLYVLSFVGYVLYKAAR